MSELIERIARGWAILGGLVVVAITFIVTTSIVGRWLFSSPLLGDTELVEYGMAIVVAAFLPLCQWRGENIIVDFFTASASQRTRDRLDRLGALTLALMLGLIAWRTGVGAFDQHRSGSVTMLMQLPVWCAYAFMTLPMATAAAMAAWTAVTGRSGARAGPPTHNPVPESAMRWQP